MPDFSRVTKKFLRDQGNLQDCVRVYQAIRALFVCCLAVCEHCHLMYETTTHRPMAVTAIEGYTGKYSSLVNELFGAPLRLLFAV